jgi:hypothetical protein
MPILRSDLLSDPPYARAQSTTFVPDLGKSWTALDLSCATCGAPVGQACTGPRICSSRMSAALQLARAGDLQARGPASANLVPEELKVPALPQKACGIAPPQKIGRKPKLGPEQRAEVVRRYRAGGVTYSQLAAAFDVNESTIALVLRQAREREDPGQ